MVPLLIFSLALGTSPKDAKEAERLVKQSIVEYNVGDFDSALADVTKAYKLRPVPALLFNIGQCHRALHHWEKAEFFYRGYLREKPDASNRDKVEVLIAEMQQKQQAETGMAIALPPPAVAAPPPTLAQALAPEAPAVPLVIAEPPPPPHAPPSAPAAATEVSKTTPEPARSHPSGWAIALGTGTIAGAVVAGIGGAVLISYQSYYNGLTPPGPYTGSTFVSKRNQANTWQVVTPIAAGVAAACLVGTVLTW